MRSIILFALFVAPMTLLAQVVDGHAIEKDSSIQYITINVADAGKFGKTMYRISIDYGQKPDNSMTFTILDDQGKPRIWYSQMEPLNYMAGFGWVLMFKSQTLVPGTNSYLDSYLMRRK